MRRGPRLIQPWDRHPVLRPTKHWAHRTGLRRSRPTRVTTAAPVVRVHALQIKRTLDDPRENLVIRQIGREPPQKSKIRVGNLILDFVPMLRALFQFVRLVGDDLDGVHACGCTGRISDAATNRMDRRVFEVHRSSSEVITHAQDAISADHHSRMHRRERPVGYRIFRRLSRRIICLEKGQAGFPCVHAVNEILAPQFARHHVDQVLDVNRRQNGLLRAMPAAIFTFHPNALAIFDDQPADPFVGQNHAAMRFDEARQRHRQRSRSALRQWPALSLLVQRKVRGPACHGVLHRLQRIGAAQHEGSAMVVLECIANNFPGRHGQPPLPEFAVRVFRQTVVDGFSEANGCKHNRI